MVNDNGSKDESAEEDAVESVVVGLAEEGIVAGREAEETGSAEDCVVETSAVEAEEEDRAESFVEVMTKENTTPDNVDEESLIVATIEVEDVAGLYAEFRKRGAMITQPLEKQVWGGTDFYVRDLDGAQISFVEFGKG